MGKCIAPEDFDAMIAGKPRIDVDDWERNTAYIDCSAKDEWVRWFWAVLRHDFGEDERREVLKFATGTHNVPPDGFKNLKGYNGQPYPFTIQRPPRRHKAAGGAAGKKKKYVETLAAVDSQLPTVQACFNILRMPPFSSREACARMVRTAIEGADAFDEGAVPDQFWRDED